jgi:hypothetical protein
MERGFFYKYYSIAFATLPGIAGGLALELNEVGLMADFTTNEDFPKN